MPATKPYPLAPTQQNKLDMKTKPTYQELETEIKKLRKKLFNKNNAEDFKEIEHNKISEAVEQSANIIVITDTDGNIEYVNENFIKTTGYSQKEVTGQTPRLLNAGEQKKEYYSQLWKTIKAGKKWKGEFCNKTKNGKIYWEQATITPIKDDNNNIINFLGVKENITERKKNKKELKQRENYLVALNKATEILSTGDLKTQIQRFTEIIGKAAHASRTYIFKNHKSEKGELLLSQIAEYIADGIKPEINNPELQNLSYTDWLPRIHNILKKGDILSGKVSNFPQIEREILEPQEIKAILIIPIIIEKEFWGFIGFDNCLNDNEWQTSEIEYLKASAEKISTKLKEHRKQKLLENENKRFHATMDSIDAVVYVADMQTYKLLFLNKYAKQYWGDKVGEKCHKTLQGLDNPCDFCTNNKLLNKNGKPNEPYIWEFQNTITKQWYQCRDQAIQWTDESLVRLEIATDITKRKNAEQAVKESKEKLKEAQKIAQLGHWELDIINNKLTWSDEIYRIFDLKPQEFAATYETFLDNIHPDDRDKVNQAYTNSLKTQTPYEIEHRLLLKSGKIKYVLEKCKTKYDKSGNPLHSLGTVSDITIQKENEKALKESKEKYRLLTEIMKDVVVKISTTGKLLYVSPSVEKFSGYKPEEEIENDILKYFAVEKDYLQALKLLAEVIKTHKSGNFEFLFKSKNKKPFPVEHTFVPLINNNKVYAIQMVLRDITERKNAEEALKISKEKAEESDRLKSAFLANMSHEIRTPMNAILGFAGFLKKPTLSPAKRERFVNIINNSGNHLLNLINDIVDISKIDAGQMTIIETECKLNEFLFEIYQFFYSLAAQKNEQLEIILHKGLPNGSDTIKTDTTRLRQILINIIGNAVKFTPLGSIEIGYSINSDNMIEFSVKDTGIGISKKDLPVIFKRFRQADETSTRKYGGTGLGLAISKACADLLNGKIWVSSELNKGSTFYFTIPYKAVISPEIKENSHIENTETIFIGKTILIVEDEPFSCLILEEMLEPTQAIIIKAENGLQAIELCKNNSKIDIILMDIQLPKLDGLKATKVIKKMRPDLPIISQTANAMQNDRSKSLDAGCIDYITKPINEKELIEKIAKQIIK